MEWVYSLVGKLHPRVYKLHLLKATRECHICSIGDQLFLLNEQGKYLRKLRGRRLKMAGKQRRKSR
jgi:hypothetical protein